MAPMLLAFGLIAAVSLPHALCCIGNSGGGGGGGGGDGGGGGGGGNDKSLKLLDQHLNIQPVSALQEGDTGYTDAYVSDASELDCDFADASTCQWRNVDSGDKPALDNTDFALFMKTGPKSWPALVGPAKTPAQDEMMALLGGESGARGVWLSRPFKCTERKTDLQLRYWMFRNPSMRVLQVKPGTYDTLWDSGKRCTGSAPRDGICKIELPPSDEPFHIAIAGSDFRQSFLIIDDIGVRTELGADCRGALSDDYAGGGDEADDFAAIDDEIGNQLFKRIQPEEVLH